MFLWGQGSNLKFKVPWKNLYWKLILRSTPLLYGETNWFRRIFFLLCDLLPAYLPVLSCVILLVFFFVFFFFLAVYDPVILASIPPNKLCSLVSRFSYMIFPLPRMFFLVYLYPYAWPLSFIRSYSSCRPLIKGYFIRTQFLMLQAKWWFPVIHSPIHVYFFHSTHRSL